jgi:tetratricopeptide (TPR) repeat protein
MMGCAKRRAAQSLMVCTLVLFVGCASTVEAPRSVKQEANADANGRARRLYIQGDYAGALLQARRAYEAAASVEDEDGIAESLLNRSMIEQQLGHHEEARQLVDRILAGSGLVFSAKSKGEAAFRRAVLAANDRDHGLCEQLLRQVEIVCTAGCTLLGKVANLRAQLAIEDGQFQNAVALAERGLVESRAHQDAQEEANALRLGANAMVLLGNVDLATVRLNEALLLDKRLGLSRKVYRDLFLLGIAAQRGQQEDVARGYWLRAREVAQADHNAPGVQEVDGLLGGQQSNNLKEVVQ